jgi:di/tricarboxylate transporter
MTLEMIFVAAVLVCTFAALIREWLSADAVLMGALAAVTLFGVIDIEQAMDGFANPTIVALGSLYIVSVALRNTGALSRAGQIFLGGVRNLRAVIGRLSVSVSFFSAFLNNTPVVAMGIPTVQSWAKQMELPPSKILIPLSYASILGGVCTLIGTSTNLVLDGLMRAEGLAGFGFFELAGVGLPCVIVGWVYLVVVSPWLLEERRPPLEAEKKERRDVLELMVQPDSPLVGQTVEETNIRKFPDLHLIRIDRGETAISPIQEGEFINAEDRLFYVPEPGMEIEEPDLSAYPGLDIVDEDDESQLRQAERETHQIVIREGSRLIRRQVRDARFLERFNAIVTGIRRRGRHIRGPVEDIRLQAGDTILLDTGRGFHDAFQDNPDFYVVSGVGGIQEQQDEPDDIEVKPLQMGFALAILVGIVGFAASGVVHISLAALAGCLLLIGFNIVSVGEARQAVDWEVLIVIGAALGLARAIDVSGLAAELGNVLVDLGKTFGPIGLLAAVVVGTMILTELITNNGAVALFFPVALSLAKMEGLNPRPFIVAMAVAGSLSMSTPLGYQTNLMVYSAGNYHFSDFAKVGLPLQIALAVVIVTVVPVVWSF